MNHIPWVEKYRPQNFDDIILEEQNQIILQNMLEQNKIPNMLFYGPPGTGKTTTIINLINEFQSKNNEKYKELVIHLNASDDRGIDIIRNQISTFTTSAYLFNKGTKFIVLDEIDYMTKTAQIALYNLIKNNTENVRFCLICNYISKLDRSLQNACMSFKFNSLPRDKISSFLNNILVKEKLDSLLKERKDVFIDNLIDNYKSDVRSMINHIQSSYKNNSLNTKIMSKDDVAELLSFFLKENRTFAESERKMVSYLKIYNIEKQEMVVKIINYILLKYPLSNKLIDFIQVSIRYKNFYLPEFNIFFISKIVSLLSD